MYRLSLIFLLLSIPFLPSTPYAGIPLWAWTSLGMSLLYALTLIFSIEKTFDEKSLDE